MPAPATKTVRLAKSPPIRRDPATVATEQLMSALTGNGIASSSRITGVFRRSTQYSLRPPCRWLSGVIGS